MGNHPHRRIRIPLQVSMILIFSVIILGVMSAVIYLLMKNSNTVMEESANRIMSSSIATVTQKLNRVFDATEDIIADSDNIIISVQNWKQRSELLKKKMINDFFNNDFVLSFHYVDLKGDAFSVDRSGGNVTFNIIKRRSLYTNKGVISKETYDDFGDLIKKRSSDTTVDPRIQVWVKEAFKLGESIWHDPYVKFVDEKHSLLMSKIQVIYNEDDQITGIIRATVDLSYLTEVLNKLDVSPNVNVFITGTSESILSYMAPGVDESSILLTSPLKLTDQVVSQIFSKSFRVVNRVHREKFKGEEYLTYLSPLQNITSQNWTMGIAIPINDLIGNQVKLFNEIIYSSLYFLILGVLFFYIYGRRVSLHIARITKDMDKTAALKLVKAMQYPDSRIKEVSRMYDSLLKLTIAVESFKSYLPLPVLRTLFSQSKKAQIGGESKEITIMFTDIASFTTIMERMDASKLVDHMDSYFTLLCESIDGTSGIVDKFIGDAVMAFWGAPNDLENQAAAACRSALLIQAGLRELEPIWGQQGLPALHTRIGIHKGAAIVGNVGYDDRFSYSALGDSVNLSSRLEGLGKIYGCNIIVSDTVYEDNQTEFCFLPLDIVAVAGQKKTVRIYELHGDSAQIDQYASYVAQFDHAFSFYIEGDFATALTHFIRIEQQFSRQVHRIIIERCEQFIESPPAKWDGAWNYQSKE